MVDPALFSYVEGYDAERLTGYAWGLGVERAAGASPRDAGHPLAVGERPAADGAVRMRVPVSWLREYVASTLPVDELGELLRMTGTKLEAHPPDRRRAEARSCYRVGRVLTRDAHPDADRLSLCTVDVGEGEPRQIVCGATNFDAGATVAVALPGAPLPDGTVLRKAKLRGVGVGRDDAVGARAGAVRRARGPDAAARRHRAGNAAGRACCRWRTR